MVAAAIAVVSAIGDVESPVQQEQSGALVLNCGVECKRTSFDRRHVERPPGAGRSIIERHREDEVLLGRTAVRRCHRVHEHRSRSSVDDRRSGDPERVDVAARQRRRGNIVAELLLPDDRAAGRIERVDLVLFGGDEHEIFATASAIHEEGLRVGRTHGGRFERGVHVQLRGRYFGERRIDVDAVARRALVMHENAGPGGRNQSASAAAGRSSHPDHTARASDRAAAWTAATCGPGRRRVAADAAVASTNSGRSTRCATTRFGAAASLRLFIGAGGIGSRAFGSEDHAGQRERTGPNGPQR